MSPSLREALALLTSDRRFAEITASFNGMNLRQRFPDLTREEQAEIVRAARGFVQNQAQPQARTDSIQHSNVAPQADAARDLRPTPPPVAPVPEYPTERRVAPETVGDPPIAEPATRRVAVPNFNLRRLLDNLDQRPLVVGVVAGAIVVLVWILGSSFLSTDPADSAKPAVARSAVEGQSDSGASRLASTTLPAPEPEPPAAEMPAPEASTETPVEAQATEAAPLNDTAKLSGEEAAALNRVEPEVTAVSQLEPIAEVSTAAEVPPLMEPTAGVRATSEVVAARPSEEPEDAGPTLADPPPAEDIETVATLSSTPEQEAPDSAPAIEPAVAENTVSVPPQPRTIANDAALVGQIQARLRMVGYDPGPIDGILGPRTAEAIRAFQRERGLRVDGEASELLLGILATYSGLEDASTQTTGQ